MFLRFSTKILDTDSTRNLGILVAAHELRDEGNISKDEHEVLRKALKWFNEQLSIPKILEDQEHRRAISWFKPDAREPIRRMWELAELLKYHGIEIEIHKTNDPGIVIYEDGWQVIAKPVKGKKVPW
jgi:hypothetical protein